MATMNTVVQAVYEASLYDSCRLEDGLILALDP